MSFEKNLSQNDITVLWAALAAMAKDVHAPQDNLNEEQWTAAEALWARLDVGAAPTQAEPRLLERVG